MRTGMRMEMGREDKGKGKGKVTRTGLGTKLRTGIVREGW